MEENTNPTQPETTQGFDASKVSKNSWIITGIAALGVIGTFLPWVTVSLGFLGSYSEPGTSSRWGIISLIAFILVIAITLFGNMIKVEEKQKKQIMSWSTLAPALFCIIFLINYSDAISFFGIGYWITLVASIATALIGFNVIKLK